jgi:hypothetical protein
MRHTSSWLRGCRSSGKKRVYYRCITVAECGQIYHGSRIRSDLKRATAAAAATSHTKLICHAADYGFLSTNTGSTTRGSTAAFLASTPPKVLTKACCAVLRLQHIGCVAEEHHNAVDDRRQRTARVVPADASRGKPDKTRGTGRNIQQQHRVRRMFTTSTEGVRQHHLAAEVGRFSGNCASKGRLEPRPHACTLVTPFTSISCTCC